MAQLAAINDWNAPLRFAELFWADFVSPRSSLYANPLAWARAVDPMVSALAVVALITLVTYGLSVLNGNCSWVDRLWSLLPVYYALHFAVLFPAGQFLGRARLMTLLVSLWGARLTYNFYRKGGYEMASEDHRWPVLREIMGTGVAWQLFKFLFIALYQNILIFLFAGPPVYAAVVADAPLHLGDLAAAALFAVLLVGETVADEQQWAFQTRKYSKPRPADPTGELADGFLQSGLFRYSRHPNFFCEMSMWWAVYLFSVTATGFTLNWTIVGTVLLTLLFQGSTTFTEMISRQKYPKYREYEQTVSRLIPWFPRSASEPKARRGNKAPLVTVPLPEPAPFHGSPSTAVRSKRRLSSSAPKQ